MKKIVLLALVAMVTVCASAQTKTTPKKVTVNQKTNAQKVVVYAPFNKGTIIVKPQNGCTGCKKVVKKKPVKTGNTESQASINARLANEARIRMEMEYARLRDSINYANWLASQRQCHPQPSSTWRNTPGNNNFQKGYQRDDFDETWWERIGPKGRRHVRHTAVAAVATTVGWIVIHNIVHHCWCPPSGSGTGNGTTPPPSGGPANVETVL